MPCQKVEQNIINTAEKGIALMSVPYCIILHWWTRADEVLHERL